MLTNHDLYTVTICDIVVFGSRKVSLTILDGCLFNLRHRYIFATLASNSITQNKRRCY